MSSTKHGQDARMSRSKMKVMLIVFFDAKGIVHHEYVPPGKTVNAQFCKSVLMELTHRVARVRPEIRNSWKLHHDNAPAHTAFVVTRYLTRRRTEMLPQPPYSRDMSPSDFFCFPASKGS